MKKLILLLFIPLVFGCDIVKKLEDKKNDLDEFNLNGKVKSLKETTYSAVEKFGEPVKDELVQAEHDTLTERYFNKDGFMTERNLYYYYFGELRSVNKYKYDEFGNKIELNTYDKGGELLSKSKYEYNDDGNLNEESYYDEDGELMYEIISMYDDKGNKIEDITWDKDGQIQLGTEYKYDDDGNMIEKNNYYRRLAPPRLSSNYKFEYDDKGNQIELAVYYKNHPEDNIFQKFRYDDKGNRIEKNSYNLVGELEEKKKYKYDDAGNLIESNSYDKDGQSRRVTEYKYEFDNNKNWFKIIVYVDGIATEITEREIEYYD